MRKPKSAKKITILALGALALQGCLDVSESGFTHPPLSAELSIPDLLKNSTSSYDSIRKTLLTPDGPEIRSEKVDTLSLQSETSFFDGIALRQFEKIPNSQEAAVYFRLGKDTLIEHLDEQGRPSQLVVRSAERNFFEETSRKYILDLDYSTATPRLKGYQLDIDHRFRYVGNKNSFRLEAVFY